MRSACALLGATSSRPCSCRCPQQHPTIARRSATHGATSRAALDKSCNGGAPSTGAHSPRGYWTQQLVARLAYYRREGETRFVVADVRFDNKAHVLRRSGSVLCRACAQDTTAPRKASAESRLVSELLPPPNTGARKRQKVTAGPPIFLVITTKREIVKGATAPALVTARASFKCRPLRHFKPEPCYPGFSTASVSSRRNRSHP